MGVALLLPNAPSPEPVVKEKSTSMSLSLNVINSLSGGKGMGEDARDGEYLESLPLWVPSPGVEVLNSVSDSESSRSMSESKCTPL